MVLYGVSDGDGLRTRAGVDPEKLSEQAAEMLARLGE